jgi:tetratricopeptide (TPR) repeat protein
LVSLVSPEGADDLTDLELAILEALCRPFIKDARPPGYPLEPASHEDMIKELTGPRGPSVSLPKLKWHLTRLYKTFGVPGEFKGKKEDLAKIVFERGVIAGWSPAHVPEGPVLTNPRCMGRKGEIDALVAALAVDSPRPVLITGAAGIGKSTLASKLALDDRIGERFGPSSAGGERRHVVSCGDSNTAIQLTNAISESLGDAVGVRLPHIVPALRGAFLVLDGLEIPWKRDTRAVEHVLTALAAVEGLALVCCIRGKHVPQTVHWGYELELAGLDDAGALALFADVHEDRSGEPGFAELMELMDGHPLGIELLAGLSRTEPSLQVLVERLEEEGPDLMQRFVALLADAIGDVSDDARRLFALVAAQPAGIAHVDLRELLPGGERAAANLRGALLASDAGGRLRLHNLVRALADHADRHLPTRADDRAHADGFYCALALLHGPRVGRPNRSDDTRRLRAEFNNIVPAVGYVLRRDPSTGIRATLALKHFSWFTGISIADLLEGARLAARGSQRVDVLNAMGLSALACSDHATACERFTEARALCEARDVQRQATCTLNLAEVALREFDDSLAGHEFQRALELYRRRAQRSLGVANCLLGLGQIDLRESRLQDAERGFADARELYDVVPDELRGAPITGDPLGVANCIKGAGDVAWRRSDLDAALRHFQDALTRYRSVHHVLGEANCLRDEGEVRLALATRDGSEALRAEAAGALAEALALFQSIGNFLGRANCFAGLAELALAHDDVDTARRHLEGALPLYRNVHCCDGQDNCARRLVALDGAATAPAASDGVNRRWTPDDNA